MFKAFVLVRNLKPGTNSLDFGEFTINLIGLRFAELKEVFSSSDVNPGDWVFEKSYTEVSLGPLRSPVDRIPTDIEEVLLLLRLYHEGDLAFIKLAIAGASTYTVTRPSRAMNDLNSYVPEAWQYNIESEKCGSWKAFADSVRASQSWSSDWFAAARRFFLSGGAKPFDPARDDVDRILDYATALEATLVPEKDYNTNRISNRAAALITPNNAAEMTNVVRFMKRFYDLRSRIVHGSGLDDRARQWLSKNRDEVERRVREVLVTAVQKLPRGEKDRRTALAGLYDPTDEVRGNSALQKFKEIKTAEVRQVIAAKIAQLAKE